MFQVLLLSVFPLTCFKLRPKKKTTSGKKLSNIIKKLFLQLHEVVFNTIQHFNILCYGSRTGDSLQQKDEKLRSVKFR